MIRPYEENDLESIIKIYYLAAKIAHHFLTDEFLEKEKINIKEVYIPNTKTNVYTINEEVVGFISMMDNEIGGIFIHPDHQRKSIGEKLINFVKNQNQILTVEVFEKNEIGKSFYYKNGFKQISEYIHSETGEKILRLSQNPE